VALPPDRLASYATVDAALAAYRAEPPVRVIFENGAGNAADPGSPVGTFERHYTKWPPEITKPLRYYLHADGKLSESMPVEAAAASSFDLDPDAGERSVLAAGADPWAKLPQWDWQPPAAGKALVFESAPLAADRVFAGSGSADLFVRSTVDDADLQITLSEVRPDGQEMFVQAGWLRASYRALAPDATELWPDHTWLYADVQPLPAGQWTPVRVELPGFGHVFRAGSSVRLTIDTPGGTRSEWRFALKTFPGAATHTIAHSTVQPSSIALPLLDDETAPSPLPPCPSLRGQPCRAHTAFTNRPAN
jgi:predicted acyl esterase